MAEQVNLALVGSQDAATAMANAQTAATEVLKRAGHQK